MERNGADSGRSEGIPVLCVAVIHTGCKSHALGFSDVTGAISVDHLLLTGESQSRNLWGKLLYCVLASFPCESTGGILLCCVLINRSVWVELVFLQYF